MQFLTGLATASPIFDWPPKELGGALLASALFGVIGIVLAILGFKVFDWLTPGNLQEEIIKKNNIAAAILGAGFVIGICIIVAAAVG